MVTGGLGYIGQVLTRELVSRGAEIVVLDNELVATAPPDTGQIEYVVGDIRQPSDVKGVFDGADAVIHLAAVVGDPACDLDPELAREINFEGTVAVVEECRRAGVRRLVLASTCSNYGTTGGRFATVDDPLQPQSCYAETKVLAEEYVLAAASDSFFPCVLRLATVYGLSPRMRFDLVVNVMTARAVREGFVDVYGGQQWRPFLHVRDAARLLVAAAVADPQPGPEIYNCGSDSENYRLVDVGHSVADEVSGTMVRIRPEITDSRDYRVHFADTAARLGFVPEICLPDGIREMKEALRAGYFPDFTDQKYHNNALTRRFLEQINDDWRALSDVQ